ARGSASRSGCRRAPRARPARRPFAGSALPARARTRTRDRCPSQPERSRERLDALERGVAEDQAFLADVLEGDRGFGVPASTGDGDHDALTESIVEDRVAGRDLDRLAPHAL